MLTDGLPLDDGDTFRNAKEVKAALRAVREYGKRLDALEREVEFARLLNEQDPALTPAMRKLLHRLHNAEQPTDAATWLTSTIVRLRK